MARIVVALGGNALMRAGAASALDQQRVADRTARRLVPLLAQGDTLVIVHGNGPQVGSIVFAQESSRSEETPAMPLDTCVAMSQGSIGYWLQQALTDEMASRGLQGAAVSLVTQVVVDADDAAFAHPTKPIGTFHATADLARAAAVGEVEVREDAGRGWRRVVPSPVPVRVVESDALKALVAAGVPVIVAGGGGVPVVHDVGGTLEGVEAVVDKDFTAVLVAELVAADQLVVLTSVAAVMTGFGTARQRPLGEVTVSELEVHLAAGEFAAGSMAPKVRAAIDWVRRSGRTAVIGELDEAVDVLRGARGTRVRPDSDLAHG